MSAEIFWFSGTGNSLHAAKRIAAATDAKLTPISTVIGSDRVESDADAVGIVFPTYFVDQSGIPLIVKRFIGKLAGLESKYVFAVYTCGGGSISLRKHLKELIHEAGGELAAGFEVHMPQNAFVKPYENEKKVLKTCERKIDKAARYIAERRRGRIETSGLMINLIFRGMMPLFVKAGEESYRRMSKTTGGLTFEEMAPLFDRSYFVDDLCNGCGTCVKVCPVSNIVLIDKKPVWQNRCENCLACFNWCPKQAIHGGVMSVEKPRYYRHPDSKVGDFVRKL